jgi:hypothetical protein
MSHTTLAEKLHAAAKGLLRLILTLLAIILAFLLFSFLMWLINPPTVVTGLALTLAGLIGTVAGIRLVAAAIRERKQRSA